MGKKRPQKTDIEKFVIDNVESHPSNIVSLVSSKFKISRQAANRHVGNLVNEGALTAIGSTKGRRYSLNKLVDRTFTFSLTDIAEDVVWRDHIRPLLEGTPVNILSICQYGLTEIVNNAIDHSNGKTLKINLARTVKRITMLVRDDGVGIFKKLKTELGFVDEIHAILELTKGKLTTDPKHHTGEGIFFASRMYDTFTILSGSYSFTHQAKGDDWILDFEDSKVVDGTVIWMVIDTNSTRTIQAVFDEYTSVLQDHAFSKTHVPVFLAKYGDENLISRSQARRVLARLDRFKEVWLDFEKVESIGQAFADEIFRVFKNEHPEIEIVFTNANKQVESMIKRVK